MTQPAIDVERVGDAIDLLAGAKASILDALRSQPVDAVDPADLPLDRLERLAREIRDSRAARSRHFPPQLFQELGWEILLRLFIAAREGTRLSCSDLAAQVHGSATSTIRWIRYLEQVGLTSRHGDDQDRRVLLLELTGTGERAMSRYLAELGAAPPQAEW